MDDGHHSSGDKVSILVVDDRADKLLTYEVMLASLNQNVVCARSGKEGVAAPSQRRLRGNSIPAVRFPDGRPFIQQPAAIPN